MTGSSIAVLGAGFAGAAVAQELARLLPGEEDGAITLVDQNNFSLFTPMLTEVVGGQVDPGDIVTAVRTLSPRVTFEQGRVDEIDVSSCTVTITVGRAEAGIPEVQRRIEADHLVIALGSVTNFHGISGLAEHALTIKSVGEAATIRDRTLALLERADEEPDRQTRRTLLTFVVGGGGFSGVETMAALNDLVRESASRYPHVDEGDIRTVLVHPGDRVLPEIGKSLASYAERKLRGRGVEVVLDTLVKGAGAEYVEVESSQTHERWKIPARTLVWAGGVTPSPVIGRTTLERGRHGGIVVDACCRVPGHPGIWALGDCAEILEPGQKSTYAPTAQNAMREGKQVARNIVATLRGGQAQPFVYHPIGELAIVGRRSGVASIYGMRFSGTLAWAMWRAIYLAKLPGRAQRTRVGLDWLLDLVFGREVATGYEASAGAGALDTHQDQATREKEGKAAASDS